MDGFLGSGIVKCKSKAYSHKLNLLTNSLTKPGTKIQYVVHRVYYTRDDWSIQDSKLDLGLLIVVVVTFGRSD